MLFFVYCGGSTSHVLQLIQTGFPPIERLITHINQKRVFLEKADQSNNLIKRLIAKEQYLATRDNITRLNFRIPRNFGPPHLHVSGGFEDRGITQ